MRNILLLLFLTVSALGFAQETQQRYTLSLEQAVAHALEHNYTVINSKRDIEKAERKKWETTATGLPQINAGVDYTYNIVIPKTSIPAQLVDSTAGPGEFRAVEFSPKQTMTARTTLNQLIFDGSYIVALQASKTYLKYYQNYKRKTDQEVREMVVNAYSNVLLTEESIEILKKNKSILEKTLHDTDETFKQGLIEEESVEQLQITLATVNNNLNNSQRLREISLNLLKLNLGIDLGSEVILTDKLDALTQQNLELAFSSSEFDVKNNIDYQIGENYSEQRRLEYKLEKAKALPSLSANLNLGTNAFSDERFDFLQSNKPWFAYSSVGASLNWPIFTSFGRHAKIQQAKIAYDQAKTDLTHTEQQLKLAYLQAKSEYEFSIEQYATYKSNLKLAERIENKQQVKFTEGLSTSFDFNDAQQQLYTAQQQYLQSMIDVINKRAALEKIITKP
ncbi:TolC family protein [Flavobacterium sp. MAH-1]|uniref:TolC family protein n=1 Tax=Flavobacterium agri TaxID=2743471 RepID=A0A7Y8Y0S8_9FLAO|nr:TolC family protein [Flavobacterium agri]NUY80408.1 TolC family protein [Flavobacterium agri]NYA70433.1 TolC family protein [Flavobacterium agri]